MKESYITITGLRFSVDGKRIGRGSLITGRAVSGVKEVLTEGVLQMGRIHYDDAEVQLPHKQALSASFDGRAEYWVTLTPEQFMLREKPQAVPEVGRERRRAKA